MFRRKKTEGEDGAPDAALAPENLVAPAAKVGPRPGFGPGASQPAQPTLPNRVPTVPLRPATPEVARPMTTELPRRPAEPIPAAPASAPSFGAAAAKPEPRHEPELRQLLVGREITLSGEITTCDRLLVEGSVEANLSNCADIEIAQTGLFKGTASVDHAEIHGRFEGSLTVKTRLLIKSTGRVSGSIRYGQLEVECGGQISGEIQATGLDAVAARPAPVAAAPTPAPAPTGDLPLNDLGATRIV